MVRGSCRSIPHSASRAVSTTDPFAVHADRHAALQHWTMQPFQHWAPVSTTDPFAVRADRQAALQRWTTQPSRHWAPLRERRPQHPQTHPACPRAGSPAGAASAPASSSSGCDSQGQDPAALAAAMAAATLAAMEPPRSLRRRGGGRRPLWRSRQTATQRLHPGWTQVRSRCFHTCEPDVAVRATSWYNQVCVHETSRVQGSGSVSRLCRPGGVEAVCGSARRGQGPRPHPERLLPAGVLATSQFCRLQTLCMSGTCTKSAWVQAAKVLEAQSHEVSGRPDAARR